MAKRTKSPAAVAGAAGAVAEGAAEERSNGTQVLTRETSEAAPQPPPSRTDHMRILLLRRTRLQSRLSNALRGGVSGTREFGDLRGELDALAWVIDVAARHFQGCRP